VAEKVYFTDMSASWKRSALKKVEEIFELLDPERLFKPKELIAVKLHFGEAGNTAHIRPQYVRRIVDRLHQLNTRPFLTDTNTLYVGSRIDAASHLDTAGDNGFTREVTAAPLIIADGLRGNNHEKVPVNGEHIKEAYIAGDIHNADGLIALNHFKGHELSGFGGAIKNLGMGCAAREGKLNQHSNVAPKVKRKKCIACGDCSIRCHGQAIEIMEDDQGAYAHIHPEQCVGCAECILVCPEGAIQIQWNESVPIFMEKMVEYTMAVVAPKKEKIACVTFITDVSPLCDCVPFSDAPIVPNIGMLASIDPVALDQCSVDMVNMAPGSHSAPGKDAPGPGEDKFKALFPQIDWEHQLKYAEEIGLGRRDYELVTI
jgi:hypothetical protein